MNIYLVHFLADEDIYYIDQAFKDKQKAIEHIERAYLEFANELVEEEMMTSIDVQNQLEASRFNAADPNIYVCYGDIQVEYKIPHFGYVQEIDLI